MEDGEWVPWSESVPKTQLEPHRIVSSDVVITTTDTVRYSKFPSATIAPASISTKRPFVRSFSVRNFLDDISNEPIVFFPVANITCPHGGAYIAANGE